MPAVTTHETRLAAPQPFDLRLCLFGHGWIALAPHRFDEERLRWHTVLRLARSVVDATVGQRRDGSLSLRLDARRPLSKAQVLAARAQVRHMMRLDCDLEDFHARCRKDAARRWIAARGAGRLLRSATVFEDLMKLLFTTNTSWSATVAMTRNLVEAIGDRAPSGTRAFPTPRQCLQDEAFYRNVVRCGYRARAALELADGFATGRLRDEQFLDEPDSETLWRRLCGLRGFGPYAAGQAMRLCGHYDRLAIDSWCRAQLAQNTADGSTPSDPEIERHYQDWTPYRGLTLWCDLTASWHH